jgi:hypothetical protein
VQVHSEEVFPEGASPGLGFLRKQLQVFPEGASPGPSGFKGNNSNSELFPESSLDTSENYKRIRRKKKRNNKIL